ncbi:unnamed protein product [Amoebophrya sp. A25]|nr:unnamed protein product [Amoebophrya sp. A25]|eukprot:GSA25T00025236001.1
MMEDAGPLLADHEDGHDYANEQGVYPLTPDAKRTSTTTTTCSFSPPDDHDKDINDHKGARGHYARTTTRSSTSAASASFSGGKLSSEGGDLTDDDLGTSSKGGRLNARGHYNGDEQEGSLSSKNSFRTTTTGGREVDTTCSLDIEGEAGSNIWASDWHGKRFERERRQAASAQKKTLTCLELLSPDNYKRTLTFCAVLFGGYFAARNFGGPDCQAAKRKGLFHTLSDLRQLTFISFLIAHFVHIPGAQARFDYLFRFSRGKPRGVVFVTIMLFFSLDVPQVLDSLLAYLPFWNSCGLDQLAAGVLQIVFGLLVLWHLMWVARETSSSSTSSLSSILSLSTTTDTETAASSADEMSALARTRSSPFRNHSPGGDHDREDQQPMLALVSTTNNMAVDVDKMDFIRTSPSSRPNGTTSTPSSQASNRCRSRNTTSSTSNYISTLPIDVPTTFLAYLSWKVLFVLLVLLPYTNWREGLGFLLAIFGEFNHPVSVLTLATGSGLLTRGLACEVGGHLLY